MARSMLAGCFALAAVVALSPASASASWLSFGAQLQANSGTFRIVNFSDPGFSLTSLVIDLGDNAVFDTSTLKLGKIIDTGATLTSSPLATTVINGASSATFNFTGFGTADLFTLKTKFTDLLHGGAAAGSDFNNATLTATFSNGQVLQTGFVGGPTTPSANRKSFIFAAIAQAVTPTADTLPPTHHPEPSSIVLLLLGLTTLGAYRLRAGRLRQVCNA